MCASNVAENLVEAVIHNADEKTAAGDFPEAVRQLTVFIDSIEKNAERNVQITFGPALVLFYSMRARLFTEIGIKSADASQSELARNDVQRAESALEKFYPGMEPAQKESIRTNIRNAIGADEKLRIDSIAVLTQMRKTVQPSPNKSQVAAPAGGLTSDQSMETMVILGLRALAFIIGAIIWGISLAVIILSPSITACEVISIVPLILAAILGMQGWDWFSQYQLGTVGNFIKFLAFLGIGMTLVGMILVAYWTGKSVVRWFSNKV